MSGGISQLTKMLGRYTEAAKQAAAVPFDPQRVADSLPPIDDQTAGAGRPSSRRKGFGARGTSAAGPGPGSAVAGADVAESMEDFFRNSSIGQAIEKIVGGYALGDLKAEDLLMRILETQRRLEDARTKRPGSTDPFYLEETLLKQSDLFRRLFSSLGDPDALARSLAEFRKKFPATGGGGPAGGDGTWTSAMRPTGPAEKCCDLGETLDILRKRGMIR